MSDCFMVATHTNIPNSEETNLVVLGTFKSLEDAKQNIEAQAAMLLNDTHKGLSIYKLSSDSLMHTFQRDDLKHVFKRMAENLNNQVDSLKKQADQAQAAAGTATSES